MSDTSSSLRPSEAAALDAGSVREFLLAMVAACSRLAIVPNQVACVPFEAAAGLGLVVAGVPFYYWRHARR